MPVRRGTFLTDGSGRAVYLLAADGMNKSTCSGACASAWPPVMATGQLTASGGAKAADLGTITRPGGGKQVTYDGHALYYFAGDSGPDQTSGQGSDSFGAKWWLVAPSGTKITAADTATGAPASTAPASGGGASSGYGLQLRRQLGLSGTVTTFLARITGTEAGLPPRLAGRPVSGWAFTGLAVTSFGGPLALAALIAPAIVAGASASAGLAMIAAVALFAFPLVIWLRYARQVSGPGGLSSFVEAAAGRRIAQVQAGLWIVSYLLYLLYTTAQIVYDTLPAVLPGERRYQPLLEIAIPVALAGVMIAGRRAALLVAGGLAAGQLVLAAALGGRDPGPPGDAGDQLCRLGPGRRGGQRGRPDLVAVHLRQPAAVPRRRAGPPGPHHPPRPHRRLAGDRRGRRHRPSRHWPPTRRSTQAAIPGMTAAELFAGHGFAVAVGVGVAVQHRRGDAGRVPRPEQAGHGGDVAGGCARSSSPSAPSWSPPRHSP